jgi:acetyl esterase
MNVELDKEGPSVQIFVPETNGPYPTLIYCHGGGWVIGNLESHDELCRIISKESKYMVVSVDYRLAPEYPFPTPLQDCYSAAKWVWSNAETLQVNTERLVIGSDSSGGDLAAAVCHLARNENGPEFVHQLLLYPVTEYSFDTESYKNQSEGNILSKADMEWFWNHYLQDDIHGSNPYASPLKANSFEGLPPGTIVTCGFDPLRDECAVYAAELEAAGIDVKHLHYPEGVHGLAQYSYEPRKLTLGTKIVNDIIDSLCQLK